MHNFYTNYTVESERRGKRRWFDARFEQKSQPIVDIRTFNPNNYSEEVQKFFNEYIERDAAGEDE